MRPHLMKGTTMIDFMIALALLLAVGVAFNVIAEYLTK